MKPPIPYGLTPDQFATRFRRQLEQHSSALFSELRSLFSMPIGVGVTSGSVEVFLDTGGEFGPHIGVYFSGETGACRPANAAIVPRGEVPIGSYLKSIQPFDRRYFKDEEFGATNIQADVVKAWFAEWWWKAGGWSFPLRVELAVHDDFGNGDHILLSPGPEPVR